MWILLILALLNNFYQNSESYSIAKCYYSTCNSLNPNHFSYGGSRIHDKYLSVSIKKIRRLLLATASKNGNNIYNAKDNLTGTSKEFKLSTTNIDTDITNEIKVIQNRIDEITKEQKLVQVKIDEIMENILKLSKKYEDVKLSKNEKKIVLEDKRISQNKEQSLREEKQSLREEKLNLQKKELMLFEDKKMLEIRENEKKMQEEKPILLKQEKQEIGRYIYIHLY